jgi:signal transduction histidine kinase
MHRWRTPYEGRPAVIGTALDITERKRLERARDDFYAMVTHDLKSPLSVIQGYADLIVMDKADKVDRETLEMAQAIGQNAGKIKALVENFLLQSRLESGVRLELSPVDPAGIMVEVRDEFSEQARQAGLTIEVEQEDGLREAFLDKRLVERALGNLVQNALNYTPPGGRITLKTGYDIENESSFVVFSVCDTGPGIPLEDQGRVFEKYYRSSGTSKVKGTGLGLNIVKAVAEAHGGRVEMHCPEGIGCTFKLVLPA